MGADPRSATASPAVPAPSPRTSRPPEMSSTVAAARARVTGLRITADATSVPRSIRVVTVAAAARTVNPSASQRPAIDGWVRWSATYATSYPICSAVLNASAIPLHGWVCRTIVPTRTAPAWRICPGTVLRACLQTEAGAIRRK